MITVGSLFAGIGGLELGLEMTGGFKTVWQVEIDSYARRVLAKHWPDVRRWNDITTFPPKCADWSCDLICGGFPCQDISYAGKGAGLSGARSGLFYEVIRVARLLRPRWLLLENVAALLSRGLGTVLKELSQIGYVGEWHCIPAAAVGAPHIRDRVFILAHAQQHGLQGTVATDGQAAAVRRRLTEPCCQDDVSYTQQVGRPAGSRESGNEEEAGLGWGESIASGEDVPDAAGGRLPVCGRPSRQGRYALREDMQTEGRDEEYPWTVEPAVGELVDGIPPDVVRFAGRTATGVPNRVDKLRCLGNAVVPQVAEYTGRQILRAENNIETEKHG